MVWLLLPVACLGVVGLHAVQGDLPGDCLDIARVLAQHALQIGHCRNEVMTVLAQQRTHQHDFPGRIRQRSPWPQHRLGITDVTWIALCAGQIEIQSRQADRSLDIARIRQQFGPQPAQFASGRITGLDGQAIQHNGVITRDVGGRPHRKDAKAQKQHGKTCQAHD